MPSFSVTSIMDVIYGSIICQLSEPLRRSSIPIKQYFYLTNFWQSCQFICMCYGRYPLQYVQVCSKGLRISFIIQSKNSRTHSHPLKEVTCDCDMSVIHIFTFTIPDYYTPFKIFMYSSFPYIFSSFNRLDLPK